MTNLANAASALLHCITTPCPGLPSFHAENILILVQFIHPTNSQHIILIIEQCSREHDTLLAHQQVMKSRPALGCMTAVQQRFAGRLQGVANAIPVGVCPDGALVPQAVAFHSEAQAPICLHVQGRGEVLGAHLQRQLKVSTMKTILKMIAKETLGKNDNYNDDANDADFANEDDDADGADDALMSTG